MDTIVGRGQLGGHYCWAWVGTVRYIVSVVALTDFIERTYDFDGRKIVLQVWDTAGGERYDSITTQYFRAAQGYILAYDITQEKTFEVGVRRWKKQIDTVSTFYTCISSSLRERGNAWPFRMPGLSPKYYLLEPNWTWNLNEQLIIGKLNWLV